MAHWTRCTGPTFAIAVYLERESWGRDPNQAYCQADLDDLLDYIDEQGLPEPDRLIFVAE